MTEVDSAFLLTVQPRSDPSVSDFFVWLDPIATNPTCYYQLERMI